MVRQATSPSCKGEAELKQAKSGGHARIAAEEKRLRALREAKLARATELRDFRLARVQAQFDAERRSCQDNFDREQRSLQDRLAQELTNKQKKGGSARRFGGLRGEAAPEKPVTKRDTKPTPAPAPPRPLQKGEVEEDFEEFQALAAQLAPNLEVDLEIEQVRPGQRDKRVNAGVPREPMDMGGPGKKRRVDFDFKGKSRAEVSGARITVWYEEEHGGRKTDVPYGGVVASCDPREGLYVKFEGSPEEMLITNEDDWRWGAHSRKPPGPRWSSGTAFTA